MTRAGKPRPTGRQVSNAEFRRLWTDRSLTVAQIGALLGITEQAVASRAKTRGLPKRGHGKCHAGPILPAREVEFRAMYQGGVQTKAMAAHFCVAASTIASTAARLGLPRRGKGWCHKGIALTDWAQARLRAAMAADAVAARSAMIQAGAQATRLQWAA